jgi:hypothetical protein
MDWKKLSIERRDSRGEREELAAQVRRNEFQKSFQKANELFPMKQYTRFGSGGTPPSKPAYKLKKASKKEIKHARNSYPERDAAMRKLEIQQELERLDMKRLYQEKSGDYSY